LFEYDPTFGIKTIDELESLCQEYKKETELEELNDKLIDVVQAIEDCSCEGNNRIVDNLSKIKALITETADIISETDNDKCDEDFVEALENCIFELE